MVQKLANTLLLGAIVATPLAVIRLLHPNGPAIVACVVAAIVNALIAVLIFVASRSMFIRLPTLAGLSGRRRASRRFASGYKLGHAAGYREGRTEGLVEAATATIDLEWGARS